VVFAEIHLKVENISQWLSIDITPELPDCKYFALTVTKDVSVLAEDARNLIQRVTEEIKQNI